VIERVVTPLATKTFKGPEWGIRSVAIMPKRGLLKYQIGTYLE
jgi:hypothetical protein